MAKVTTLGDFDVDDFDADLLFDAALANSKDHGDEAVEFVKKLYARYEQYGMEAYCSLNQLNWLRKIAGPLEQ